MTKKLSAPIKDVVLNARAKSLATVGPNGLNVVPVSTIFIQGEKILLVDYFFNKTRENLKNSTEVALVAWSGPSGWQIKARHEYQTNGKNFEEIKNWAAKKFSDRTVHGVIELSPTEFFNISL